MCDTFAAATGADRGASSLKLSAAVADVISCMASGGVASSCTAGATTAAATGGTADSACGALRGPSEFAGAGGISLGADGFGGEEPKRLSGSEVCLLPIWGEIASERSASTKYACQESRGYNFESFRSQFKIY